MNIEPVKINCIVNDSIDCYRYFIKIYNNEKKLVVATYTVDGIFLFNVPYCGIYYFFIIPTYPLNPRYICKKVYVNPINRKKISFVFSKNYIEKKNIHPITFNITDSYYQGLKIEKGEMNLWLSHM